MAGLRGVSVSEIPMEDANALLEEQMKRPAGRASLRGVSATEVPLAEANKALPQPKVEAVARLKGMSVAEAPMEEFRSARRMVSGNPSYASGGMSPQAESWLRSTSPATATPGAPRVAVPAEPTRMYKVGQGAANVATKLAPVARGLGTAAAAGQLVSSFNDYKLSDPVDSSAAGTLRYVGQGEWGKAGDSLAKGAQEAAMDVASAGTKMVDGLTFGATNLNQRLDQGLRGLYGDRLVPYAKPASAPARPAAAPATGTTPPRLDSQAGAGRGLVTPAQPSLLDPAGDPRTGTPLPTGWTSREVAGASGVRRVTTADGRTLYTNLRDDADNVKLMSSNPGLQTAPAPMAAGYGGLRGGAAGAPAEQPMQTEIPAQVYNPVAEERRQRDLELERSNLRDLAGSRYRSTRAMAVQGLRDSYRQEQEQNQFGRRLAADNGNAEANRAVQRRGQDIALRGQELDSEDRRYTADMSARTAAMKARYDRLQSDRQYQLDVAKFGEERAKTMFDQREKGQKSFDDWAGSIFTTTDENGKAIPDEAKKAEFVRTASAAMGNIIADLQAKGDPDSLAKAQRLSSLGLGAMDAEDRAVLKTLFDRRERFAQTRGAGPFSAGGPVSDNLFDYAITGQQGGLVQNRYKLRGGGEIPVNDLRYTEPANDFLPDVLKTPTTNLGPTLRERQALQGDR